MIADVKTATATSQISFRGAGDSQLARVEHSWSLSHPLDARARDQNDTTLDTIAKLMRQYPTLDMDVHVQVISHHLPPSPSHHLPPSPTISLLPSPSSPF